MIGKYEYIFVACIVLACLIPCITTAESVPSLILKGDEQFDEGKFQEAIATYEESIAQDPKQARAWAGKGYALNALKDYENALGALNEAIVISPKFGKAMYERGNALYGLKRYEDAISSYDEAIKIYPQYAYLAYYGKAKALSGLEKHNDALSLYEKAISLKSDYAPAWNFKGEALTALGRYDEAYQAFDKALALEPNLNIALMNRENVSPKPGPKKQDTTVLPSRSPSLFVTSVQTPMTTPEKTETKTKTGVPFLIVVFGVGAGLYLGRRKV